MTNGHHNLPNAPTNTPTVVLSDEGRPPIHHRDKAQAMLQRPGPIVVPKASIPRTRIPRRRLTRTTRGIPVGQHAREGHRSQSCSPQQQCAVPPA